MPINAKSLVKSGLIAGIVINISAITMVPVVGDRMNIVLKEHLCPPLSHAAMLYFMLWSLSMGFFAMTVFAFVKDLFKTKLMAAVTVALAIWYPTYFSSNTALIAYGFMPWNLSAIGSLWGLLEILLATIIGSRFYKDR